MTSARTLLGEGQAKLTLMKKKENGGLLYRLLYINGQLKF